MKLFRSALSEKDKRRLSEELTRLAGMRVYPASIATAGGATFFLGRSDTRKLLGILFKAGRDKVAGFMGEEQVIELGGQRLVLKRCPTDHANADALRQTLPYTVPGVIGLRKSFGCGDRLGLATPGHIRVIQGTGVAPVFAQQSIREMSRTDRTPEEVMDDATWGVFQEGWRDGWGADADHLKTTDDIDRCAKVGFTFFTIDPSEYVDNTADKNSVEVLAKKVEALPWKRLESSSKRLRNTFLNKEFDIGRKLVFSFSEEELLRAATKYGKAVAHTAQMYRYLVNRMGSRSFELEISVDETETPTSIKEHFFVAKELKRLGVKWVSLAPRYIGRFEKGVDYIGDLDAFEAEFIRHVGVAKAVAPYKLSLHSGSDKFSIYPIIAKHGGDLIHIKTAGTSYLEALRAVADLDPTLFREILSFAFGRYGKDKATYHVSANLDKVPPPGKLADPELAGVLDLFDGRQLLHVTYGSVLTARDGAKNYRFRDRLLNALQANEEKYYAVLEDHFAKHLVSFIK